MKRNIKSMKNRESIISDAVGRNRFLVVQHKAKEDSLRHLWRMQGSSLHPTADALRW